MIIYTRKKAHEIRELAASLSSMLSSGNGKLRKYAHGIKMAIAYQYFSLVKQAFEQKSHGGTDESGDRWQPLSEKYLAYGRRFGKGEQTALKKTAGLKRGNNQYIGNGQTLLNKKQADLWWETYRRYLAINIGQMSVRDAKAFSAATAWNVVKRAGGKTKLNVFGKRQVDILRDTGVLMNSLSPGVLGDANYKPPSPQKGGGQVVRDESATLIVGTNVKYAAAHHFGIPGRLPRRRLWPDGQRMPTRWTGLLTTRIVNGMVKAVRELTQ